MQKLAAYLLERRDDVDTEEARSAEVRRLTQLIFSWLAEKGARDGDLTGRYDAEDGSDASFCIEQAIDGVDTWWLVRLTEAHETGRRFVASISVTNADGRVVVYATLEAGSEETQISPLDVDPRCPKIVRRVIEAGGPWFHGASELQMLRTIKGFDEGTLLAGTLLDPDRTIPIVVVTREDEVVLPGLERCLAYDLAGLANVALVDPDATWALTDCLGRSFSCFRGSVRLYWPRMSTAEDPFRHPLWTAQRFRTTAGDPIHTRDRFRRQLRSRVMRASALSVVRPPPIDRIRTSATRRAFAEMKERANSLEDFQRLADIYAVANDRLRLEKGDLQETVEQLQSRIAELEAEHVALITRVENAEVQLQYRGVVEQEISPVRDNTDESFGPPKDDEIRFYKKMYSAPTHDVMVRVQDCGCNKWQGAHAADKAKKGIAKLENGRSDWQKMQHCGACTGGGMWRVRW